MPSPVAPEAGSAGFFFGGGGGAAFFFAAIPAPAKDAAALPMLENLWSPIDSGAPPPPPPLPLTTPYLWLRAFAVFRPEATCVPCRWWKLFAVLAAALASANETEEGSLLNCDAVRSAACFCAHVVPPPPAPPPAAGALGPVVFVVAPVVLVTEGVFVPPMPNPGTDIPAAPSRLAAALLM